MAIKYKRVLIKISGEALSGDDKHGVNKEMAQAVAKQLIEISSKGVQVGVVVGGGNFYRGRNSQDIDRATGDYMGMLATVMNGLALQDTIINLSGKAKLMTSIEIKGIGEAYNRRQALNYLDSGNILIFAGGTGSPFFTTDTTAALRAAEIDADVLLLAKNIDAVYSADPSLDSSAERYSHLTYMDIISRDLRVMDLTAASLCMDNQIKIYVFALADKGNLLKVVSGENIGTLIE